MARARLEAVTHGRDEPWTILAVPASPTSESPSRRVKRTSSAPASSACSATTDRPRRSPPRSPWSVCARRRRPIRLDGGPPHAQPVHAPVPPLHHTAISGLEARGISAWFGTHHVLDRVSLEMPAGEVTALIGPSGCGKSTFLRILNRMHEMIPAASLAGRGAARRCGHLRPAAPAHRRATTDRHGVPEAEPVPAMSIYDHRRASFRLTGAKVSKDEKDHVVETCLSKAGLWNEVRDRLRQPGGGCRAVSSNGSALPERWPSSRRSCSWTNPAPRSTRHRRGGFEQTIVELAAEVTIVIVTHNMQQAARVSHRCAFFLAEQRHTGRDRRARADRCDVRNPAGFAHERLRERRFG